MIKKEMEQTNDDENTYIPTSYVEEYIREIHRRHIVSLGMKTVGKFKDVPKIYGIPKMHKDPIKFRFITGAKKSTLKPLTMALQKMLSHFSKHVSSYCNVIKHRSGIKHHWSIDNSMKVVNDVLASERDMQVFSADFSSLFTDLPHQVVKENIRKLIIQCMRGYNYVRLQGDNVSYANADTAKCIYYRKEEIFFLIDTLLESSFVRFGSTVYQQIKSIPQEVHAVHSWQI
ncbi:hypothetical protein Y032_0484g2314 [Ancylostoma ceylanicum]|uniref:Reverse transcriptase domain-containing protein n=1 Tax=Ancylostoma ceylanicum TaxID=53326 RepID=A0A016WVR1_9BILA|nr:hypothetical protein Y032_0484g2314 [Ancylostoma ceylanicum]